MQSNPNYSMYPSIQAAILDFQSLCGYFLNPPERSKISALIVQNGLSRRHVFQLAAEIEAERQKLATA